MFEVKAIRFPPSPPQTWVLINVRGTAGVEKTIKKPLKTVPWCKPIGFPQSARYRLKRLKFIALHGNGMNHITTFNPCQEKINRATDTTKIMAQTKSSLVGACARIGESRSTCRVMAAVISWLTLSKIKWLCMVYPL